MKLRDVLLTALSNLTRHRVRAVLTTVGVVVGILTIVTMVSLGIGVQREMIQTYRSVGLETLTLSPVTAQSSAFSPFGEAQRTLPLTLDLLEQLVARDDVVSATPELRLPNSMQLSLRIDNRELRVNPWTPGALFIPDPFSSPPEVLGGDEEPPLEGGGVVVADRVLIGLGYEAEELTALLGREAELVLHAPRGETRAFPLRITGIIDELTGSVRLSIRDRLALLEWWFNDPDYLAHRGYDQILVRATSLNAATNILDWVGGLGYQVRTLKTLLDMANRGMIVMQTMLGSVGGLALLVASLGIANTMIMAVYERTREIGILKAVGASPGQIRALFVVEASLIGLLGGITGTILGWLLGKLGNWLIPIIIRMQFDDLILDATFFQLSPGLVAGALAFAALVGLLAGLYPAARAARLAPLEALRYE